MTNTAEIMNHEFLNTTEVSEEGFVDRLEELCSKHGLHMSNVVKDVEFKSEYLSEKDQNKLRELKYKPLYDKEMSNALGDYYVGRTSQDDLKKFVVGYENAVKKPMENKEYKMAKSILGEGEIQKAYYDKLGIKDYTDEEMVELNVFDKKIKDEQFKYIRNIIGEVQLKEMKKIQEKGNYSDVKSCVEKSFGEDYVFDDSTKDKKVDIINFFEARLANLKAIYGGKK